jgi:hypothetical protein
MTMRKKLLETLPITGELLRGTLFAGVQLGSAASNSSGHSAINIWAAPDRTTVREWGINEGSRPRAPRRSWPASAFCSRRGNAPTVTNQGSASAPSAGPVCRSRLP